MGFYLNGIIAFFSSVESALNIIFGQVEMKNRFLFIILAIILVLLINPFIGHSGKIGHLFALILITMIPLASYYALVEGRTKAALILFIAGPFVILDAVNMFYNSRYLVIFAYSFGTILYFFIIIQLLKNLISQRVITADLINCAISIYLLIGIMWAGVYTVLEGIWSGSFSGISPNADLLYFSFATLTTVGYGDVAPKSILATRLAVFEAAMGSIYMAIIVALIVGRYMSLQADQDTKSETGSKE